VKNAVANITARLNVLNVKSAVLVLVSIAKTKKKKTLQTSI